MHKHQLLEALKGVWAIEPQYAMLHFGAVANFLKGNTVYEKGEEPQASRPSAVNMPGTSFQSYDEAPAGSVALIPLSGPMMKNSMFCGPAGTTTIASRIAEAVAHKNIDAVIVKFDSGGGAVNSINPLVEAIKAAKETKPVIAFVDDVMASAALMAGAHASLIIASHEMASVGSLGVMASFADFKPVYEKEGVIFHTIYADQSTAKNKPFEKALEGDYTLFKEKELNPLAQAAIDEMKKLRGSKIKNEAVYAAEMFFAGEAQKIGLIDEIGNLDYAVKRAKELSGKTNGTQRTSYPSKSLSMKKEQIPALMMILGLEMLELHEGKASFSKEDVAKLQNHVQSKYGKPLMFAGASFEEDGSVSISEKGLYALNAFITRAITEQADNAASASQSAVDSATAEMNKRIEALNETIAKLSGAAEGLDMKAGVASGKTLKDFKIGAVGINAVSADRPWNAAALAKAMGRKAELNFIIAQGWQDTYTDTFTQDLRAANLGIDITNLNSELGAYYREVDPVITDMNPVGEDISKIFPWDTSGIQDIYTRISSYITEHLQPRNPGEWADKGSNEFQAESVQLKPWELTRTFAKEQMQQFMVSWLATKTVGTDPYQESFVAWFINDIKKQIAFVERPKNAILGVYVEGVKDIPGKSIHSMNGALKTLQNLIQTKRIMVFKVGKGSYSHLDESGNVNKNHVFHKTEDMIKMIPQNLRDAYDWRVLMSKEDFRERNNFIKQVVANDSNYAQQEAAAVYANFEHTPVPYWPNGLYVITLKNNGAQLYREKGDDNCITIEKLKRNTYVHMDGAYGFIYPLTGKKFETRAELLAAKGEFQRIFTNGEFGPYTAVDIAANDTTPSVKVHNVLQTSANTSATAITGFDDAEVGDVIYVIGGSSTNPSSIAANAANFIGIPSGNISFTTGVIAKFLVTAAGKFTLVDLYQQNSVGAIQFIADNATPSVAGGYLFITNNQNTDGNAAITDFEDAAAGVPFKVLGGGGTYPSTIAKSGKFAHISGAWTGTDGAAIILQKRSDGLFVEVIE